MTALCGGGTSSPKAGFGASVAFTASGLAALLNNIPTVWAVPLAGYIGLITYDLATFCGTDPPPVPVLSAPDWINVISIADPVAHLLAVQKMQQLVGAFAWCSLCQCDNGTIPNCGPAPAAPASVPTVNPPQVVGTTPSSACATYDSGVHTSSVSGSIGWGRTYADGGASFSLAIIPPGATFVRATATWTGTIAPVGWSINSNTVDNPAGSTIRASDSTAWTSGVPKTLTFTGTLDTYWLITVSKTDTASQQYHLVIDFFCGGATPTLPQANCGCVPDANTIGLLSSIYQTLTTVQRFKFPFAYILGAVHSGVSGTGATAISRLIGFQLTVTAQPPTKRTSLGNPSYIYDLGWVSVSDADGMIEEKRLTRTSMLWFPQLGQLATSFNYFLQSGVTITWTEVQPETGVTAA